MKRKELANSCPTISNAYSTMEDKAMTADNRRIDEKRLLSVKDLQWYVGLGKNRATEWGRKIGAERRIGKRVFFDREIVDRA